jgi:lysozyme
MRKDDDNGGVIAKNVEQHAEEGISMSTARRRRRVGASIALSDGQLVEGCDVSHFQGDIDWSAVASAAKYFVYIKATDGVAHTDDHFAANYAGAGSAGILRGAYHFFRHSLAGADQANYFLSVANPKKGDLPPVLDLEDPPAEQSVSDYVSEAASWVSTVSSALGGQPPVIYCSPSFWKATLGSPDQFGSSPLWIAHYTTHDPTVPSPWNRFTFWQYTDSGTVPGISANVDRDRFHGSMDDLNNMVLTGPPASMRRGIASQGRPRKSRKRRAR